MSYGAKVFNVMIASPGDVASERSIIRDVIYEWNAIHSNVRKIVLLPLGWESHASPEMGNEPQDIINTQVLDKCDVLVGVFWTRIGTPTTQYPSGTVEEIEKHIQSGKLAMLYFSNVPVPQEKIVPEQYQKLQAFKDACKQSGLYFSYEDTSDFRNTFFHHLQLKLNHHPLFSNIETSSISKESNLETLFSSLDDDELYLIKEASLDPDYSIQRLVNLGDTQIITNGKHLTKNKGQRAIARWEFVIEELISKRLLVDKSGKGQRYSVTKRGYNEVDPRSWRDL